jgi:hypothetical protein
MILPIQVGDYNIPVATSTGAVAKRWTFVRRLSLWRW